MAEKLLKNLKQKISCLELEPSTGGCFELTVDDQLVYSKLATGEFPDEAKLIDRVGSLVSG